MKENNKIFFVLVGSSILLFISTLQYTGDYNFTINYGSRVLWSLCIVMGTLFTWVPMLCKSEVKEAREK